MSRWRGGVALLLLLAATAVGQTIPEPELIDLGDNHFTICSPKTASAGIVNMRVKWSDDATWTAAEWEMCHSSASGGCTTNIFTLEDGKGNACVYVTEVPEGTALLVHVNFWNGSAWTTDSDSTYQTNIQAGSVCAAYPSNCTDIDADGGGAGTDRVLRITTTSDGVVDVPTAPTHSRSFSAVGSIDNEVTVTVTSGECDDLQAKLTSQAAACIAAASSPVVYAVKIPAGAVCYPEDETAGALNQYIIPDITDPDCTLLVYSESADTDVDPPSGGLIAEDAGVGAMAQNLGLPSNVAVVEFAGSGEQNVRFRNVKIQRPDARLTDYPEIALTGWTDTARPEITFATTPDADQWGNQPTVYFPNAQTHTLRTGIRQTNDSAASAWLKPSSTVWEPNWVLNPVEPGSTEAGVASKDVTKNFTSATAVVRPVLTFSSNLNYASGYQYTLAASNSISGGTITLASGGHVYATGGAFSRYGILVQGATGTGGTTDDQCNTIHVVDGHNAAGGTWEIENAAITCNGGTAEVPLKGWFHGISGYTYSAMACLFTTPSQTTAKLWLCKVSEAASFVPDFTGLTVAGWLAYAPAQAPPLVNLNAATGVTFESVLFDAGGPPWDTLYAIDASASVDMDLIVIGSRFIGGRHWQTLDPASNTTNVGNRVNDLNFFQALKCRACEDVQFINNVLETDQNLILSADDASIEHPRNITVSGMVYKLKPEFFTERAESGGIVGPGRQHLMELKNGAEGVLVEGLAVSDQRIIVTGATAPLLCQSQMVNSSVLDYVSRCKDIELRNSFIRGVQAIYVHRSVMGTSAAQYTAHGPVRVHNNFFAPAVIRQKPSGDYGYLDAYPTVFTPNFGLIGRSRDVTITNNTFAWQAPQVNDTRDYNVFLDLSNLRTAALTISGNVYVDMDASSSNQNHFTLPSSWSWANYEAVSQANGVFSTLGTHSGNRTVACTEAPTTTAFEAANNAHSEASGRLTGAGGSMATNWPLPGGSADGQKCNDRLDAAFVEGTWEPSGSAGADIDAILDAIGQIRNIQVTATGTTTASVQFEPWSASAVCEFEWKAGPVESFGGATGVTQVATGTGKPRTVNLTGLPANTVIDAQIQCDRGLPAYVSFETQ